MSPSNPTPTPTEYVIVGTPRNDGNELARLMRAQGLQVEVLCGVPPDMLTAATVRTAKEVMARMGARQPGKRTLFEHMLKEAEREREQDRRRRRAKTMKQQEQAALAKLRKRAGGY